MLRRILSCFTLPLLLLLSSSSGNSAPRAAQSAPEGFNPGPDIIAGDMEGLQQFGSSGTLVGLGISTTSCNAGNQVVNFFAMPATNHPIIPHNLYRMSGGADNEERFEQVGQSWVKHTFGADQANACFVCMPGGNFTHLGVGCSDTYASFQSATQSELGSRAWVNPFTGVFSSNAKDHTGHMHTETSHMLLVESSDLNEGLNPGATYYAEIQYISSDEYAWCQTHPGQCNMYNDASYRRFRVSGTTSFNFSPFGSTVRMTAAVHAWTGATINPIEPEPGLDGRAFMAFKVTTPAAGVWHYEYALYNENLDRAIQSFSVPLGCAVALSNLGFHAPLNHPGFPNDGTLGDAGFSNAPWTSNQTTDAVSWNTETFAQNQNANAIRWGTLYNFRFDSDRPPVATNATVGFFKTGAPITVAILGPDACAAASSPTPTATATATATATPTATATATPTLTPTPPPASQLVNLSTRMRIQTGDNLGIGGFIIAGTAPMRVLIRALGPSLISSGVSGALGDPALELHGSSGFVTTTNHNWRDTQEAEIQATSIPPSNDLESAILVTLDPGLYSAVVRGENNTTGLSLIEVYDLDQGPLSKLANLSTRAFVDTGDNIVIAGFILGSNSGNDRVMVRGIGPDLAQFGVPNPLADPTLELRDSNGALLAYNNDWQDNCPPESPCIITGLPPPGSPLDAVIVATLPPGLYTALLAGLNNGTGVGLIELYDLGPP